MKYINKLNAEERNRFWEFFVLVKFDFMVEFYIV